MNSGIVDRSSGTQSGVERRSGHPKLAAMVFGPLRPALLTGRKRIILLLALVAAGTIISLARTPRHTWNILWAEDGAVFVSDAVRSGPEIVFQGYAGYMHFVPRVATEFAVLLPLPIVPVGITILSALITSLIACACFVFMETRIAAVELRFASWIVCLALPIMGGEVANNVANLHWYLLVGGFCALVVRSRSAAFVVAQSVVVFCAVTSDALALLLLPFAVFRWFVYPQRRDRVPSIAFLVGAFVQLVVVIASILSGNGRPGSRARPGVSEILDLYTYRVVLDALFGVSGPTTLMGLIGSALPGVALAAVIGALVAAAIADPVRRVGIALFALSSFAFAVVVFTLQWDGFAQSPLLEIFTGGRYAVVPVSLLLLALLQSADVAVERSRGRWMRRCIGAAVLIAVLIPVAVDYRASTLREGAPAWPDALEGAAVACEAEPDEEMAVVTIAPPWFGGMLLPCDDITSYGH